MILLKSYKNRDLTDFLDCFQPPSMRCSLNLHLRSAHEKPQQPNRFDSPTDPRKSICPAIKYLRRSIISPKE